MSHQSDYSILDILQIFAAISLVIGSHLYSCKNHLLLKLEVFKFEPSVFL